MKILEGYADSEIIVKGSRFKSEVFPCKEQSEAKNIVKEQKSRFADATHVVHAFVLGLGAEIMGMSDDGEPSGTAGRPVLDVVKGRGVTNLVLTVTRWFGGTLLGTGGLVKAYGDGAKNVLENAEQLGLINEYVEKKEFSFCAEYNFHPVCKRVMEKFSISELKETFGTEVCLSGKIAASEYELFCSSLVNASNGKIAIN